MKQETVVEQLDTFTKVAMAISWFKSHRQSLPQQPFGVYQLETWKRLVGGQQVEYSRLRRCATVTNPAKFYTSIEQAIAGYEAGNMPLKLARCYILRPVLQIQSAQTHDPNLRPASADLPPRATGKPSPRPPAAEEQRTAPTGGSGAIPAVENATSHAGTEGGTQQTTLDFDLASTARA
ncbi:MAG TPA: hypothetical protein V6D06_18330 [Trichocoleus sp.]